MAQVKQRRIAMINDNLHGLTVFGFSHFVIYVRLLEFIDLFAMEVKVDQWSEFCIFRR